MSSQRCPTCKEFFEPTNARALPFCSERCRLIDLGRWLNEEYSLPDISLDEDEPDEDPWADDEDETTT